MANQQLTFLAQNALALCDQLEKGQADTPLAEGIQKLLQQMQHPTLTVVLLGLTPESLEQSLNWLYGDAFTGFTADAKQWPGFLELSLSSGGFSFGLLKKQQQEFEEQQSFVQALQIEMGTTQSSVNNPFGLCAPSSRGLVDLKFLIPDSAAALLDSPSLFNALVAQSNMAMVAAPLRYVLSREDHDAVNVLCTNMQAFLPLLTVDELTEEVTLPEIGWWEQHSQSPITTAPKLVTRHVAASIPDVLTSATNSQRQQLIDHYFAQKLNDNLSAIFDRYQQQAGILEQRKARLEAGESTANNTTDRRQYDKIRQFLDDNFITVRKDIETQVQQLTLQQSPLLMSINKAIENIELDDLSSEQAHTIVKLTLNDTALNDLRQLVFTEAKLSIKDYYGQTEGYVKTVFDGLNKQLQSLAIPTLGAYELKTRHDLYDALDQRLEVNLNYRGEMPKRTAMTRLGESRKLIMGISMGTMVLGGVAKAGWGVDLRQSIMVFAPIILVSGFIYTYIQWPKEDAEKLDKELDKVRDGLKSELRRVVGDIQRFIQQQLFDVLDQQKRDLQKKLQHTHDNHQEDLQKKSSSEKNKQKLAQQQIDQALRQWRNSERQLERLKSDSQALLRTIIK